jgi:lipopolysaccharide biosynthesis regulator YciM
MLMKSVHISSELSGKKDKLNKESTSNRSDLLIENCFEDLQKYIELESNQEEISIWVSKILFVNKAYDEAIRSLTKISNQSEEILSMIECI